MHNEKHVDSEFADCDLYTLPFNFVETHMIRALKARFLPASIDKERGMVATYIVKSMEFSMCIPTDHKLNISQSVVSLSSN